MNLSSEQNRTENFWPVYSDLAIVMILILVLFIMTQLVMNSRLLINETFAIVEEEERYLARQKIEEGQRQIDELFGKEAGVAKIRQDGNLQIFTFSADALYPTDKANLSDTGERLMRRFGLVLRDYSHLYDRIEIEGHADETPSRVFYRGGDFKADHGNWRLSAERAITVAQLFQVLGLKGGQLAIVGRSFYDSAIDPAHNSGSLSLDRVRELNRRVTIRLFYSEIVS